MKRVATIVSLLVCMQLMSACVGAPANRPVVIRFIQMITGDAGWGIGSKTWDDNHVLLTQDGGHIWEDVTPPEPALATKHAAGYFFDRHTGWVTYFPTSANPGMFYTWRTTDDGASWTQSPAQWVTFLGSADYPPYIDFVSSTRGWIMLRYGPFGMHKYPAYLMKTTNAGTSWTIVINPLGGNYLQSCRKTGMDFVDNRTGWVTYDNCPVPGAEVSLTADGGTTWSTILLPEPASHPGLFASNPCYSHSPNLLSSTEGAVALSCTSGGNPYEDYIYFTTDGGTTWTDYEYPGGPLYLLNSSIAFAMGQEMHRSTDGGVNWTLTSVVPWDGQFSFVSPLLVWGVADSGGSYALVRSATGTNSWGTLSPVVLP